MRAPIHWRWCRASALGALVALAAAASVCRAAQDNGCAPRVAVLVYHRFATTANDSMTVRVTTFEAQLAFFRAHGYRFVPLRDVVKWREDPAATLPDRSVALTVDDGHRSVYDVLRPIVERERLPVTLFIYPSAISNASYALTWDQLRALHRSGWFDVQSHTYWHPNFNTERRRRTADDFRQFAQTQFVRARVRLEAELGAPVDLLAWPFGIYDDTLIALAAQSGYVAGFTLDARFVTRAARPLALPRFLMVDADGPAALARLFDNDKTSRCPPRKARDAAP